MKHAFAATRRALPLVLALFVLAVPAPAQADPSDFLFEVLRNRCRTSGGDFGHGKILLQVRVTEYGASGANKFTLSAVAQHYRARTSTWQNEYNFDNVKVKFPNDANSYRHTRWFAYYPKDDAKHQIVLDMKVWHKRKVLASRTITSKSC